MSKSLLKLILPILLLSFMSSVHSESGVDDIQTVEKSKTFIGKEFWFNLPTRYCTYVLLNNPRSVQPLFVESKPIKGSIVDVIGGDLVGGKVLTKPEDTFLKITLDDYRIVYMRIDNFLSEIESLKINTDTDRKDYMCVYPDEPDIYWKKVKEQRDSNKQQKNNKTITKTKPKKPGVRLGMTPQQVIKETSWGRPQSVNRTTNRYGTHEQWVYGGGNYLYFDNGELTSIQN